MNSRGIVSDLGSLVGGNLNGDRSRAKREHLRDPSEWITLRSEEIRDVL